MKIKTGYVLREVAHQAVVVPIGEAALNFNGVISLNSTGAFLWKLLEKDISHVELVKRLMSKYRVDYDIAQNDVTAFIHAMNERGLLE